MRALLLNNKVVDVQSADFPVHPSMTWADAPSGCKIGWILDNGVIKEDPVITAGRKS
jgi:hypothetical protein